LNNLEVIEKLINMLSAGALGMFGGIARLFYDVDNGKKKIRLITVLSALTISFVAGVLAAEAVPPDTVALGLTMLAGFYSDLIVVQFGKKIVQKFR
jgi:phage shock protein PspC (stress-responsive transcriptional regulator)